MVKTQRHVNNPSVSLNVWMDELKTVKTVLFCRFPSFHDTAAVDATLRYVMAFLVLLGCVKLWHLLRLSPKLYVIASSLQRAWDDMSTLTVVIFIILLAYSLAVRPNYFYC